MLIYKSVLFGFFLQNIQSTKIQAVIQAVHSFASFFLFLRKKPIFNVDYVASIEKAPHCPVSIVSKLYFSHKPFFFWHYSSKKESQNAF